MNIVDQTTDQLIVYSFHCLTDLQKNRSRHTNIETRPLVVSYKRRRPQSQVQK